MTPHILRLVLCGLCGSLAALVIAETAFMFPRADTPRNDSAQAAAEKVSSLTPPNIDAHIAAILDRPLFSSSRASSEKPGTDENDDTPAPFGGRLTGIAIDRQDREALFQNDGEKPIAVKPGETIDGWMVAAIEDDHVVLKGRAAEQVVQLTHGAGASPRPRKVKMAHPAPARPAAQNRPALPAIKQAAK